MEIKLNQNVNIVQPIPTMTKRRILKNVVVLSIGILVLFTAFDGLSMLQSTVNSDQGIGVISQAVLYICFCASALVFPKYVIKKLGSKVTLVLSMVSYIPYVAANVYPHWSVMMPTSILIGLGAALLWGSQTNYLNDVSVLYAELLLIPENVIGNEELSSNKQPIVGCVYGSLDCPLERQDKNVGIRTSSQESGLSNSSEDSRHLKCKSDGQYLNSEQIFLDQPNLDGQSGYQAEDFYLGSLTLTRERVPSNFEESSVVNKQCVNSEQFNYQNSNFLTDEGLTSKAETDKEEPSSGNPNDAKECVLNQKYCVPVSNGSITSNQSNIETDDIELDSKLSPPITNDTTRYNRSNVSKDMKLSPTSISRCLDSPKKDADTKRKSVIESPAICRKKLIESTTARFFGFHGMVFLSSFIWSNLLSYFLMRGDSEPGRSTCACGADFCDADACHGQHAEQAMSDSTRYILTGVCVCLGVSAVLLVWLLLDPLNDKSEVGGFDTGLLMATVQLARRTDLLLLMPMSLYVGMAQAFFGGDFTKAFASCVLGPSSVGLVGAAFGVCTALSALVSGWAVRWLGRPALFSVYALLNAASCVLLLAWTPDPERSVVIYAAAAMFGLYVGTTFSQIRAFYGILFKADEEAAFATFHTWYSLGFFISFVYSNYICTYVKIYVLLAVSTAGFTGYLAVERRHYMGRI